MIAKFPKSALLAFATVLAACTGVIGDGVDPGPTVDGPSAPTPPPAPAVGSTRVLRRLSKAEYTSSIRALITLVAPSEAEALQKALAPTLDRFPDDLLVAATHERRGGYHRLDQNVQQTHADIAYAVANEIGKQLTSSPARLQVVIGDCITGPDPEGCVAAFLRRFGEHVLRRPLTDADVTFYETPLSGGPASPEALADVIALLFAAPDVLYLIEREGGDGTVRKLSPYELANRLAFHFSETLPDEELFALARSGELAKEDVYAKQVDRLAQGPRARAIMDEFFHEWLRLDELERLDSRLGDRVFDAFVGTDTPTAELRGNMFADVLDAAAWVTAHGGTLRDLLQNRQSFARTPDVAKLYGVPVWDGVSEPPTFIEPSRAGLITRAAFLATASGNTRPVIKGVRIRMGLLCDNLPPPPPNAAGAHIDLSPTQTTRQVVEQLTESQGSSCPTCHATLINPLGFATENFDALGRFRSVQRLFDRFGNEVAERDVMTAAVSRVTPSDVRVAQDASDLVRYLVESKKVAPCFARNLFRFAMARNESDTDDAALLKALGDDAEQKPLADVFKSIALRPEFKSRVVKEGM